MNVRSLPLAGLVLLVGGLFGCAPDYSATAIEGRVIDEETKTPLAGTHVVVHWELVGGFPETHPIGTLALMETVTDGAGRFGFPAWGPIKAPEGTLGISSPVLIFYKPGYAPTGKLNRYLGKKPGSIRTSQWTGRTVGLRRLNGVLEDETRQFGSLNTTLEFSVEKCLWQKIPRMVIAVDRKTKELLAAGAQRSFYSIERLEGREPACPNAAEFLKGVAQ